MNHPLVSVVIPTRNAGAALAPLLDALWGQIAPGRIEIIVIDSSSTDGTPVRAQKAGARVISIPRRSFNHGRTRNTAVEAASGEFVALTVQDAIPVDDPWLAQLLTPLLEVPDVAGSYGLQVAPASAGLLARVRSATWRKEHGLPIVKNASELTEPQSEAERLDMIRFDNVTSCVRRSVWRVWPFPERIYGEDMAWARTVLRAGYALAYIPSAQVWHFHARAWRYELRRAYVDGITRVELADWPSPELSFPEAWFLIRHMLRVLLTHRFDSVATAEQARQAVQEESGCTSQVTPSAADRTWQTAMRFALDLTTEATTLRWGGGFGRLEWVQLYRFAVVNVLGTNLGAAAASVRSQLPGRAKARWNLLHWFLYRGL
jgi:rhamnosyltransferase